MSLMLTQTSELAVRAIVYMTMDGAPATMCWTPTWLAEALGCSPSHLAKTLGQLVKMGLLVSVRGPRGGVRLARSFEAISLLDVVQACQGMLVPDHCTNPERHQKTRAYQKIMRQLHEAIADALVHWRVSKSLNSPVSTQGDIGSVGCRIRASGIARVRGKQRHTPSRRL